VAKISRHSQVVVTGHSRLKDGVASLAYVTVIPMKWVQCLGDRDGRTSSAMTSDMWHLIRPAKARHGRA
jgi:hypothetical protein